MKTQAVSAASVNGVNVEQLNETIQQVTAKPALGAFRFSARGTWLDGAHNRVTIDGFYGAGADHVRQTPFAIDADEPPVLLGRDLGANPVELALAALSACLTTSIVYHAAARGIGIDSLATSVEGDIDMRGFLGLERDVRKGLQGVRVRLRIKSDAPLATLRELAAMSPVLDSITNPVPVAVDVEVA